MLRLVGLDSLSLVHRRVVITLTFENRLIVSITVLGIITDLVLNRQSCCFVLYNPLICTESSLITLSLFHIHSNLSKLLLNCLLDPWVSILLFAHALLIYHVLNRCAFIMSLLHLLIKCIQFWSTKSIMSCRSHLLSNCRLLVHISRCNRAYTWYMFALWILIRTLDTREEWCCKVISSTAISSSHHRVPSTWRSYSLLAIPF